MTDTSFDTASVYTPGAGDTEPTTGGLLPDSVIWTPEIERLKRFVVGCIRMQLPGCAVAGGQRFGKTYALKYLEQMLEESLGHTIPVVQWSIRPQGTRVITDKSFIQQRMRQTQPMAIMSHHEAVLECRLHTALVDLTLNGGSRMLLIMIDEAQNLDRTGYAHLIFLFNSLEMQGVRPFFLLVGQPELKDAPNIWRQMAGYQVLGRFFNQMHVYRGISMQDLAQVLAHFDEEMPTGGRVSTHLMPQILGTEWTFAQWEKPFREAVGIIMVKHNLPQNLTLPMQYLRSSLLNLLDYTSKTRMDPRLVQAPLVLRAIRNSGFFSALAYCIEECSSADAADGFSDDLDVPAEEAA
jgi:hypothetical protein